MAITLQMLHCKSPAGVAENSSERVHFFLQFVMFLGVSSKFENFLAGTEDNLGFIM